MLTTIEPAPGAVVADRYRVERVLGRGATGVVVAASPIAGGPEVALKLLSSDCRLTSQVQARFVREARLAASLKSEHTVRVLEVGALDSGAPFLVMELLDGEDLCSLLQRRGRLPVAEAVNYVCQAGSALAEAHALDIVHRDIKPANLFLARAAGGAMMIKVVDFGISKLSAQASGSTTLGATADGVVLGSPHYMAPEQLTSPADVDARVDVWALGVTLYELLTGRRPFPAESLIDLSVKIFHETPAPLPPEIPPSVRAVVGRCLQKKAQLRYADAAELCAALAGCAGEYRAGPRRKRWRRCMAVAGLGAAALPLLAWTWRASEPRPSSPVSLARLPIADAQARPVMPMPSVPTTPSKPIANVASSRPKARRPPTHAPARRADPHSPAPEAASPIPIDVYEDRR